MLLGLQSQESWIAGEEKRIQRSRVQVWSKENVWKT